MRNKIGSTHTMIYNKTNEKKYAKKNINIYKINIQSGDEYYGKLFNAT